MSNRLGKRSTRSGCGTIRGLKDEPGFTLVELLIVMLVLGLLAAIALPSFFGQRDKARDAEAKQTLTTARLATETYAIDNGGRYTDVTAAALTQIEETLTGAPLTVVAANAKTYRLQVVSGSSSTFYLELTPTGSEHTCVPAGTGGCEADGTW